MILYISATGQKWNQDEQGPLPNPNSSVLEKASVQVLVISPQILIFSAPKNFILGKWTGLLWRDRVRKRSGWLGVQYSQVVAFRSSPDRGPSAPPRSLPLCSGEVRWAGSWIPEAETTRTATKPTGIRRLHLGINGLLVRQSSLLAPPFSLWTSHMYA